MLNISDEGGLTIDLAIKFEQLQAKRIGKGKKLLNLNIDIKNKMWQHPNGRH